MFDLALIHYDRAVGMKAHHPKLLVERASFLWQLQRRENALADIALALTYAPTDANLWHTQGHWLDAKKRYAEAVPSYREALRLAPDNGNINYRLMVALARRQSCEYVQAARSFVSGCTKNSFKQRHYCDKTVISFTRHRIRKEAKRCEP